MDTTFLARRLVDSPEARVAGVLWLGGRGTRDRGAVRWEIGNELLAGNLLQRDVLSMAWRADPSPEWRWGAAPRLEFRRDRTLGRDLREWRGQLRARVRRAFLESFRSAEAGLSADFLNADGPGSQVLLDRGSLGAFAGFGQGVPGGPDLWLGAASTVRSFPDSADRDHWEHGLESRARWDAGAGHVLALEAELHRRVTLRVVPTSRDNFMEARASADAEWRATERWILRLRGDLEVQRYDLEDSTLCFDYHVARVAFGPRLEGATGVSLWGAGRVERLEARLAPGESYVEAGALLEAELLRGGTGWSATPAAGWRQYDDDPDAAALGIPQLRTAYAFAELTLIGDQRLPGGLRMRVLLSGRLEWHDDASLDARSLYFSLDLRKLL